MARHLPGGGRGMISSCKFHLKSVIHFFYGSPDLPPLDRRTFLRVAVRFFLTRWLVINLGTDLAIGIFAYIYNVNPDEYFDGNSFLFAALILLSFLYVPYFRIVHRRLKYLAVPKPRALTWLIFIILARIYALSPNMAAWRWALIATGLDISIYLLLLPWPDPREDDSA